MTLVPVILSGGAGSRLWPLSREQFPKQLLPLTSEHTMLQETALRVAKWPGMHAPVVVSNEHHRFIVAEQLRQVGLPAAALILEPVGRNTAPAVAAAALSALQLAGEGALLLVMPADHVLKDVPAFERAVQTGLQAAAEGKLVTFGVVPTRAETGYGYIRHGGGAGPVHAVEAFVEKPDAALAAEYVASGNYLWNSGMFLLGARRYLQELAVHAPAMLAAVEAAHAGAKPDLDFCRLDKAAFEACPADSIDYAVMEKTRDAAVVPLDAGWSDVGSWDSLFEAHTPDASGNVVRGDVVSHDSHGNYVYSESRLVATVGLQDHVVVETKDAVLVMPRSRAQDVKKIVEHIKAHGRGEHLLHREVFRPWGSYDSVDNGERHQVKRLTVKPGATLSLQMHHHRAEHWIVVKGTARVTCNDKVFLMSENESTYIPIGAVHRIENPGKVDLHIVEVQSGSYLGEDDIVRFEDTYGRQGNAGLARAYLPALTGASYRTPPSGAGSGSGGRAADHLWSAGLARGSFCARLGFFGLQFGERVALWLPKQVEQVVAAFGTSAAGGVFVPVNSVLKPAQAAHILRDSGAVMLVTSAVRLAQLAPELLTLPALRLVLLVDADTTSELSALLPPSLRVLPFVAAEVEDGSALPAVGPDHLAGLFYTSGSTGRPKGVMLSHLNLCVGAVSVAQYLGNTKEDRLLAVLPFSFDYGFSQFTTAFLSGAAVVLHDYLLPRDVVNVVSRESITGLAGVPPLWSALAGQDWPASVGDHLRYVTNSGGVLPQAVLGKLRQYWPRTKVFLMYGLTEAFRSTYLPAEDIDQHPDSIGKAIPNADVRVLREDGTECAAGELGELVHSGPLVGQGYWGDPMATAARFRPAPAFMQGDRAVWSGDTVWRDQEGFLFFSGRRDGQLKTSGYRVSPTEVEEVAYDTGLVGDAVLVGLPHERLGHELVLFVTAPRAKESDAEALSLALRTALPAYLYPAAIVWRSALPRTANGKFDRVLLAAEAGQTLRGLA